MNLKNGVGIGHCIQIRRQDVLHALANITDRYIVSIFEGNVDIVSHMFLVDPYYYVLHITIRLKNNESCLLYHIRQSKQRNYK